MGIDLYGRLPYPIEALRGGYPAALTGIMVPVGERWLIGQRNNFYAGTLTNVRQKMQGLVAAIEISEII
ncbi:hypothetical protein BOTCAL_0100g00290 [Botryotinia calthae]|uniref:Uncharacterized protein n=1 Tax=Botryotinia calthae TaxID=38488 RepID=A0A4Y8D6B8_9HELO|nr:hypothetical protein BOTCAL_0100g00290 [Botryotinia calthae]